MILDCSCLIYWLCIFVSRGCLVSVRVVWVCFSVLWGLLCVSVDLVVVVVLCVCLMLIYVDFGSVSVSMDWLVSVCWLSVWCTFVRRLLSDVFGVFGSCFCYMMLISSL